MDVIRQVSAVAGVVTLLIVTLRVLRRRGWAGVLPAGKRTARRLACLERLPLAPQHTLYLIRLGERELLVASSPTGCSLIESLSGREATHTPETVR
jgi:flagellar biogenesis protein FliO